MAGLDLDVKIAKSALDLTVQYMEGGEERVKHIGMSREDQWLGDQGRMVSSPLDISYHRQQLPSPLCGV